MMPSTESVSNTRLGSLQVTLNRSDFSYYNWVMAFERPILPFFLYTITLLLLLDLFKVWQDARLYAFAVVIPLLGYLFFVWLSTSLLWRRYPQLREASTYSFQPEQIRISQAGHSISIPNTDIKRILESRRAYYLIRQDGSADILPLSLDKTALQSQFPKASWKRSSFL